MAWGSPPWRLELQPENVLRSRKKVPTRSAERKRAGKSTHFQLDRSKATMPFGVVLAFVTRPPPR
jgi:hypothetical protein